MAVNNTQELADQLDMEFWCDREGVRYRSTRGRSGPQLNVQECPACRDRRWRVYVNAETGLGNCFVCNETFGKLKFVQLHTGLDWRATKDHVREVLREQGWRPKRMTPVAVEHGEVKLPTSFPLPTPDGRNLVYLENRGISVEIAAYFGLRCCEEGWWNWEEEGKRRGQKFDGRVIIPVYDLDGTLVTFQGRDVTGTSDRKYLFPMSLPGTGRYLYNGQNATRAKRVVIGEGAFDVMAQKIALDEDVGLRDVMPIGTFGKHLSYGDLNGDDQLGRFIQLKKAGLEEATFMWDGEWKALIAALDGAELLHRIGIKTRIAVLPAGKDPNEVPPDVVRDAFYKAKPFSKTLSIQWRLKNPFAKA